MLHDREMYGITRRQLPIPQDNLFRALCDRPINRQHLIHYAKQSVERGLDCVAAVDSDITVQDLLENLGVRNQTPALADHFFEQSSRIVCRLQVRICVESLPAAARLAGATRLGLATSAVTAPLADGTD